jgi:RHS repeat-associated protein
VAASVVAIIWQSTIGVTDRSSQNGTVLMQATYSYDALRNRVEKDVAQGGTTTVTRFGYDDAGNAWADLNGSNALQARRVFTDGTAQEVTRIVGTIAAWYLPDREGSVRNLVNSGGTLSDTITYDDFGKVTSETSTSTGDRFKYTGMELDSETGLQHQNARYYDPATGRWTSMDPIGFDANDPNLYRYVGNAPTNGMDPSGLEDKDYTRPLIIDPHACIRAQRRDTRPLRPASPPS